MDQVDREEPQRLEHHVEDLPRYQDADPREGLVRGLSSKLAKTGT